MRKILLACTLVGLASACYAQEPIQWKYSVRKLAPRKYRIFVSADLAEPWRIYSQHTPAGGPKPTYIQFQPSPLLKYSGVPREVGSMEKVFDDVFKVEEEYYQKHVDFEQDVELKSDVQLVTSCTVQYMVCTDEQCLTPAPLKLNIAIGKE